MKDNNNGHDDRNSPVNNKPDSPHPPRSRPGSRGLLRIPAADFLAQKRWTDKPKKMHTNTHAAGCANDNAGSLQSPRIWLIIILSTFLFLIGISAGYASGIYHSLAEKIFQMDAQVLSSAMEENPDALAYRFNALRVGE